MQVTITDKPFVLEMVEGAKILEIHNTGAQIVFRGWERETTSGDSDITTQGLPLAADKAIIYGGSDLTLHRGGLTLVCATGLESTINFSFKK